MNSGRVAAGGARARVLAEEDDEEGARGERQCGRAARNPMLSAHLRIADDVYYKDHPFLPRTFDLSGSCARTCSAERPLLPPREATADGGLLAEIAPIADLPAPNTTLHASAWVS